MQHLIDRLTNRQLLVVVCAASAGAMLLTMLFTVAEWKSGHQAQLLKDEIATFEQIAKSDREAIARQLVAIESLAQLTHERDALLDEKLDRLGAMVKKLQLVAPPANP